MNGIYVPYGSHHFARISQKDRGSKKRYKRQWQRWARQDPEFRERERENERLRKKLKTLAKHGELGTEKLA